MSDLTDDPFVFHFSKKVDPATLDGLRIARAVYKMTPSRRRYFVELAEQWASAEADLLGSTGH